MKDFIIKALIVTVAIAFLIYFSEVVIDIIDPPRRPLR